MADLSHIPAEQLAFLEKSLPEGMHPTLREMATSIYLHLVEDSALVESLGCDRLASLALGLTDRICLENGGGSFYLPRGIAGFLSARDREIFAAHNGRNLRELARKYNLSDMRIHQIIKAVQLKNRQQNKGQS